jgi:hypothetical protein
MRVTTPAQRWQRCQPNAGSSMGVSVTKTTTPVQWSHNCIFYCHFCCHHAATEELFFLTILLLFHHNHYNLLLLLLQMVLPSSTLPSPLSSCCPPLLLVLHCHHLLCIINIQLGHCCSCRQVLSSLLLPPPFCSTSSLQP